MIAAAALCPSPPLLARELTGQSPALPELRDACATAVAGLLAAAPDVVVVAGPAEVTAAWPASARLDLSRYAPARYAPARGVPGPARASEPKDNSKKRVAPEHMPPSSPPSSPPSLPLPLALGIGALLLDEAGYAGPRSLWSVAGTASPRECARLGRELSGTPAGAGPSAGAGPPGEYRVALLAMGDGSARRSASAPGYLDERAGPFDAEIERAFRDGDLAALAAIGPGLAADLMAAGRPSWQLLAAALAAPGVRPRADILYSGAPLGVGYLVATFT